MKLLSGSQAHLWQRLSAFYLLFYFPYMAFFLFQTSFSTYHEMQLALLKPAVVLPSLLAFLLMMIHLWIGLRDVILDYFPRTWVLPGLAILGLFWGLVFMDMFYLFFRLTAHA